MVPYCSLTKQRLLDYLNEHSEKSFHATQLFHAIYQKKVRDFDEVTTLSKTLRNQLKQDFAFPILKQIKTQASKDGETEKFLFQLQDNALVESVLIYSKHRRTLCVSSQVGCPARCSFCASGKKGLIRQLSAAEIVEQALWVSKYLEDKNERLSHIVFMGMGEPLENFDAVMHAIRILIDPEAFGLSKRRITVSTVGVVDKIYQLIKEDLKINLVISLHAPSQKVREKIIYYARKYPIEDILQAAKAYFLATKRDITFEYTLIEEINDSVEQAKELAELLKDYQCTVNLIPYNPVDFVRYKRPSVERIDAFHQVLLQSKIPTTRRYTKGVDIQAACGQLALKEEKSICC